MIYLLKSGKYLKVGYASNLKKRMEMYNTHNPNYELLCFSEGTQQDETKWHNRYKPTRNEWLDFNQNLIDEFVKESKLHPAYFGDYECFEKYIKEIADQSGKDYLEANKDCMRSALKVYNSKFNKFQIYLDKKNNTLVWDPVRNSDYLFIRNALTYIKYIPNKLCLQDLNNS